MNMMLQHQRNHNFSFLPHHLPAAVDAFAPQHRGSVTAPPPPPPPLQAPTPPAAYFGTPHFPLSATASTTRTGNYNNMMSPEATSTAQLWGLVCTLVDQGLLFFTDKYYCQKTADARPAAESSTSAKLGLVFDSTLLRTRQDSVLKALYADLPKQCSVCGLRFVCEKKHRAHMDWHIDQNLERVLRGQKSQRRKPLISRPWYAAATTWTTGGLDQYKNNKKRKIDVPAAAAAVDCHDESRVAVAADEEQTVCALCGDRFEDFYCEEAEEWLYKGTVYLNSPAHGGAASVDRSQLGPIVHAKCRSDSAMDAQRRRKRVRIC